MKGNVKIGTVGERRFIVERSHLIDLGLEGQPGVLATPWLIWFLEIAARDALLDLLEPGEASVGVTLNLEHLAPTPLGAEVVCRARVIHADGPLVTFQVEAHDGHEPVVRGTHKRRVIDTARLARRAAAKASPERR